MTVSAWNPGKGWGNLHSLRSASELNGGRTHGSRMCYMAGCKCFYCRRANSDYERKRQLARKAGDWNGIVSATRARAHIHTLSKQGVGYRAIAAASDVSKTILTEIRSGKKRRIRARSERLILAVTSAQALDGALVDASKTWRQVRHLLREGFTKAWISAQIGQSGLALQLGKRRVTVRNAGAINRLWCLYLTIEGHD